MRGQPAVRVRCSWGVLCYRKLHCEMRRKRLCHWGESVGIALVFGKRDVHRCRYKVTGVSFGPRRRGRVRDVHGSMHMRLIYRHRRSAMHSRDAVRSSRCCTGSRVCRSSSSGSNRAAAGQQQQQQQQHAHAEAARRLPRLAIPASKARGGAPFWKIETGGFAAAQYVTAFLF
jgi:hypothetical protein